MKNLVLIVAMCLQISFQAKAQTPNSENNLVLLKMYVTDFKDKPSEGDKIYLVSVTTKKEYSAVSGKTGYLEMKVPCGDDYQIKIRSFEERFNSLTVQVPNDANVEYYEFTLKYELPKSVVLKNINFETGKSVLKSESFETLNNLADIMISKPGLKIELSGHTDNTGDTKANLILSQQRADAVKKYLIKKGVKPEQLISVGYGDTMPIAGNDTPEGKLQNRRTEIKIIK